LLGELEWTASHELNDVSDCMWKSPKMFSHDRALEQYKLAVYFPNSGVAANLRRRYEFKRLNETFPRLIAGGNLFWALSVFENYVLILLEILQEHKATVPKHESRPCLAAHLKALKAYGADPYNAKYYEQVYVAISIRNCLMHTKAFLATFGDSNALRNQISQRMLLCSEDRKRDAYQNCLRIAI